MNNGKLVKAQFGGDGEVFNKVLSAFVAPFPSLASLPAVEEELIGFLNTGEFSPKIQASLDADSVGGEWPGMVFLQGENIAGSWKITEMIIRPYIGDRILIVRDFRSAPVVASIFCEANYEQRPSRNAAGEIIALTKSDDFLNWNDPVFEKEVIYA